MKLCMICGRSIPEDQPIVIRGSHHYHKKCFQKRTQTQYWQLFIAGAIIVLIALVIIFSVI